MTQPHVPTDPEARWPALVAVLAAGGLFASLPEAISVGPRWLLPAIAAILAFISVATHHTGKHTLNILTGHLLSGVLTLFMFWSLALLIIALPAHRAQPVTLLTSAGVLWVTNIVVFALWYWRLDAGGPHQRERRNGHQTGAFLFPQMTLEGPAGCEPDGAPWSPEFVDYLFLAFNTSTAFSPTDVPILSRWAKLLVMTQSIISLAVVVILAGRAVNIL